MAWCIGEGIGGGIGRGIVKGIGGGIRKERVHGVWIKK